VEVLAPVLVVPAFMRE
jgi:hypothetical protein